MDIVKASIQKPVSVIVGVILITMFGLIGLTRMPYQLSPNVVEPEITVETTWAGATPYEIERDVVEEQEKVLKGITGLKEMESQSNDGQGEITLRFDIGTDLGEALLRVSNKLNEVPNYPENTDKPVISATGANTNPIIWIVLKALPENKRSVRTYRTFFENEVRQHMERVDGVADLFIGGGEELEMQVTVDTQRLAAHNLTIADLVSVLQNENQNISAGIQGVDRRDYRIRTTGQFSSPEEISNIIIRSTGQQRITVKDVADVAYGFETPSASVMHNGEAGLPVGVKPEPGANVLEVTDAMEKVINDLNQELLKENGLYFDWTYDQRSYINGAIDLVRKNIIIGGVLAIIVLLIFLQSLRSTLIVAVSIPVSIIGCFIFLKLFNRSMNVVSMAGISFAVGMLVDNAIVVLENIDRHRAMGKRGARAAYDGTREVWGAVLASTLTTVAVFLPVVFIEEEAGQLFKDIAIAVTCAITLSLFVSVSVIPMLASQIFNDGGKKRKIHLPFINTLGNFLSRGYMSVVSLALRSWYTRITTVLILTSLAIGMTVAFFPKMEYLPQGNRNLILNILIPPPGLSFQERESIGEYIFDQAEPLMGRADPPGIKSMFYVGAGSFNLMGAICTDEERAGGLIPELSRIINSIPGMFGVSIQASIFQQSIGKSRTVSVDVSGPDIKQIIAAAGSMFGIISQTIPGSQIRPIPSLELLFPEVNFMPNRDRLKAVGMSAGDLGVALDVIMDGRKIADFKREGEKTIDLVLKASRDKISTPEQLHKTLIATPRGQVMPVSSLAGVERTFGISQIRHLERNRTVSLQVTPPLTMPLEQAMDIIQSKVIPAVKTKGLLRGLKVNLSGQADKLTHTREAMQWNFLLALAITYLLMSALFGNFIYPFIILFTVPLAAAGGFLGLKLENWFIVPQPMDIVTMLGFIILIGVVVNNAILIVHQALNNIREHGMRHREAVLESVRTRLRPIYMSAATSIFGMLPLAVAPGPGSELYRGLGAVVLGGLALSTFFTVFVIPSLLMFFIKMEKVPPGKKPEELSSH